MPIPARRAWNWSGRSASTAPSASAISTRRGRDLIISGQPERPVVRRGGDQQRLPANLRLRQQQPVLAVGLVELSRPARLVGAAAGAVGVLPRVVHAVEGDGQRRRVLLQLADRSLRSAEGLGPIRRRSAPSPRRERRDSFLDGAGADGVGADQPRIRIEQPGAVLLRAALQHHVRRDDGSRHGGQTDRQRRVHREKRRDRPGLFQRRRPAEPDVQDRRPRARRRASWKDST